MPQFISKKLKNQKLLNGLRNSKLYYGLGLIIYIHGDLIKK